ncbi:hypothetical protein [Microbacterium sp.]|uniref:hypothetical protein n=1 Tax=Microbacterium sp. TaxID=51671 RepID=UPI002612270F|nr:hypothetical protein [Microbacterium sp.]
MSEQQMQKITRMMTTQQIADALQQINDDHTLGMEAATVEIALIDELDRRELVTYDDRGRVYWKESGTLIPGQI